MNSVQIDEYILLAIYVLPFAIIGFGGLYVLFFGDPCDTGEEDGE